MISILNPTHSTQKPIPKPHPWVNHLLNTPKLSAIARFTGSCSGENIDTVDPALAPRCVEYSNKSNKKLA